MRSPSTTDSPQTQTFDIGHIDMIPIGEGRLVQIRHIHLAVFRTREGKVFATQALCPHKGGPLWDGTIDANKLVCPLHSYTFDLANGEPIDNECKALKTYPARVKQNDHIEVKITLRSSAK